MKTFRTLIWSSVKVYDKFEYGIGMAFTSDKMISLVKLIKSSFLKSFVFFKTIIYTIGY